MTPTGIKRNSITSHAARSPTSTSPQATSTRTTKWSKSLKQPVLESYYLKEGDLNAASLVPSGDSFYEKVNLLQALYVAVHWADGDLVRAIGPLPSRHLLQAASSTFSVPSTLTASYLRGSSTLGRTPAWAA